MLEGEMRIERDEQQLRLIATLPGKFGAALVTITSTFDRRSNTLHREMRFVSGLFRFRTSFPHKVIRGIGLRQFKGTMDFPASYLPAVTLRDGKRRTLAAVNASAEVYEPAVSEMCAVAGVPRIDHPGNIWGW
jgi:hypothetical protein